MKRKRTVSEKRRAVRRRGELKIPMSGNGEDYRFQPILGVDGKLVGLITDRDICKTAARNDLHFQLTTDTMVTTGRVLPCRGDEDLREALKALLGPPEIYVDVGGGIVRHGIR